MAALSRQQEPATKALGEGVTRVCPQGKVVMCLSDAFLSSPVKQEVKFSTLKGKAVQFSGERRCYKIALSEIRNDNLLGRVWYISSTRIWNTFCYSNVFIIIGFLKWYVSLSGT